jgi:hypothetical protein
MPASRSANVETSYTKKVFDFLCAHDDFIRMKDIAAATGLDTRQLRQTLPWLRKCKAIDSVESGGVLYWYATPDTDQRMRTIDEHRREDEPRNARGGGRRTKVGTARMKELGGLSGS